MRAELKELNTDQLRDYVIDLKGIENAHDWKNAKPVTLMELIEEAMANHPEVFWIVEYSEPGDELVEPEVVQIEQKNVQTEQEAAQNEHEVLQDVTPEPEQEPAQEVVQIESESAIVGQESGSIDSAEEAEPEKSSDILSGNWTEYEKPAKHKSISDLGEWATYRGRALTTSEQNYVIKGMKDEGYSFSVISVVVRLSYPTVKSRYRKLIRKGEQMSDKAAIIVIAVVVAVFIILFMFGAAKVSKEADAREDAWLREEWGDEVE